MPTSLQDPYTGRDEILAAATDMFGESGFDAVSINAIARRAGTSKANVFHHFGNKEGLYLEVMRAACKVFAMAAGDDTSAAVDFHDRVRALIQRDIELLRDNADRSHLIMREVLESGECRGRALAGEVFHDQFTELVDVFEEGHAAGEVRSDVPAEFAATMMIACNVFLFQSRNVLRHLPGVDFIDDPQRCATLISRVLFDGLRQPAKPDQKGK
jgi:TetR/AcrR family transcriptional regulator